MASEWYDTKDPNQMNRSAVIELSDGMDDDDDGSVGNMSIGTRHPAELHHHQDGDEDMGSSSDPEAAGGSVQDGLMDAVRTQMADTVWQAGKQQARKAFDLYGNIDILRPYFDVEPKILVSRLILSLVPRLPRGTPQKVVGELYGPVMIVLTLVAILLMGMKDAGHTVREGTLMGTAMGVCLGYWLAASGLFYGVSFVCNTHITFLQVLSMTGYAMFSFCVVLFGGTVLHSPHSHSFFYLLWGVVGGIAALKMVFVYLSRTSGKTQRLVMCGIVAFIHLTFLLYLHFAYHKIVEEITTELEGNVNDGVVSVEEYVAGVDEVMNELQEQRHHDIVEREANQLHNSDTNKNEDKVPELVNKVAADVIRTVTKAAQKIVETVQNDPAMNNIRLDNAVEPIENNLVDTHIVDNAMLE